MTGRETSRIFQDVEGIVIGEQWQKTLAAVIDAERQFSHSSSRSAHHVSAAIESGAQGATNDPDELVAMVVAAFR
ncbi:MAG TPA: hypothetical protein VML96_13410 [Egibacteraceae bacterium]|nr:hypothetical protein [Egibacteraceae bacterium]